MKRISFLIFLLSVERVLVQETITTVKTPPFPENKSSNGITTPTSSRNISYASTTDYGSDESNKTSFPFEKIDLLRNNTVARDSVKCNNSKVSGYITLDRNIIHVKQQEHPAVDNKSKGFIEFEFDVSDEVARKDNGDESAASEGGNKLSSFNQMVSTLLPKGIADIFRFSYVAEPPSFKGKIAVHQNSKAAKSENKIGRQPLTKLGVEQKVLHTRSPTLKSLPIEAASRNSSNRMTSEDVRDINQAAELENLQIKDTIPEAIFQEVNRNLPNSTAFFIKPIAVENQSGLDYEDQSLNLDEDNLIAPSREIKTQIIYPSDEMEIKEVRHEKANHNTRPDSERQINVQIIQDTLGGYGKKIVFSPTKQLDDFQEQAEKHFNPNDISTQTEAASRTFLKHFKGNIERPQALNSQIKYQPQLQLQHQHQHQPQTQPQHQPQSQPKTQLLPLTLPYSQTELQPKLQQHLQPQPQPHLMNDNKITSDKLKPESLLHTYIFSSEHDKDSITSDYLVQNKSSPPAENAEEKVQTQQKPKPSHPESHLHTYIFSSEFDRILKEHNPYNKSNTHSTENQIQSSYEEEKDTQTSENQNNGRIYSPNSFDHSLNSHGKNFVTRGFSNDLESQTTSYPRIHNHPPNYVEVQKSLNIHNKYITEKNGKLIEQHEIYTRPSSYFEYKPPLNFMDVTTPVSLQQHPIRVAQADEPQLSESAVEPESFLQPHQQQEEKQGLHRSQQQYEQQQYELQQQYNEEREQLQKLQQQEQQEKYEQQKKNEQQQYELRQQYYEERDQLQKLQQQEQQRYEQQQKYEQEQTYQQQRKYVQQQKIEQQQYEQQQKYEQQQQQKYEQEQKFDKQKEYEQQQNYEQQQKFEQQKEYEDQQNYEQQQKFEPQKEYEGQQSYEQQQKFEPQKEYEGQQNYEQQQKFEPQHYGQQHVQQKQEQRQFVQTQLHEAQQQYDQQRNEQQEPTHFVIEKPVPYPVQQLVPQPYPVEHIVEKLIDRPVHVDRVVEKQVNVPYPVRELVEKIIDRPVPVEKIIDRPVHIPYPVQVDHFIDRPYPVQYPVAVPVPVPVHRFIDRPYPVEKIVEKPIHVPYPVEKIVEKIIEKHVPIEVERIVEKPIEKIVEKHVDRPITVKKIINRPVPIRIPVPIGVPVAVALTNSQDSKKKIAALEAEGAIEDFFELVPPPTSDGKHGYKTLPENIDILLLDDTPLQNENNQYFHWGQQPVKRGTKSRYIKRSPEFGRHFRVEYGFKPPIVPSLEINDQGLPLESTKYGD